jgi:hypothetical protein
MTHQKIKLEIIELPRFVEEVKTAFLIGKVNYITESKSQNLSQENANVFIFDKFPQLISQIREHQTAISSCDGQYADVEPPRLIEQSGIESIKKTFDISRGYYEHFFDRNNRIYEGEHGTICPFGKACKSKDVGQPHQNTPCIDTTEETWQCPIPREDKTFKPSETHSQSLKKLSKYLNGKLNTGHLNLVFEIADDHDLSAIDFKRIVYLVKQQNHRISFAQKLIAEEDNNSHTISLSDDNSFNILVVYLNNLYYPRNEDMDNLEDEDTDKRLKIIQQSEKEGSNFIESSKRQWDIFKKNNRGISIQYLEYPNNEKLSIYLRENSYQMVFIEGHGCNENGRIELTPTISDEMTQMNVTNKEEIDEDFFVECLNEIEDVQVICLLMCRSEQLARKLMTRGTKVELIISFNHLLEVSMFSKLEKSLHDSITRIKDEPFKISWNLIFERMLSHLKTNSDVGSISLDSVRIYQRHAIPPFFKCKTQIIQSPTRPRNKFDLIMIGDFCRQKWWFLLIFLIVTLLGSLALRGLFIQKREEINPPTVLRQSNIYGEQAGGFLLSKKKTDNNNYSYYAVAAVSKNLENGKEIKIANYQENFQATIVDELENKLQPNNQNWKLAIVSFKSTKEIEMPKFSLRSIAVEGESFDIFGYEPKDRDTRNLDNRKIRGHTNDESSKNTPFGYESSEIIQSEFMGSPIVKHYNRSDYCVIGLHIEENTQTQEQLDYRGQLVSNIQESLKQSRNPDLEEVADNMQSCSL